MRIIGQIEHPILKITIFKNDNRISVKLESGLYEQTYKFRDGEGIESAEDVEKFITSEFLEQVQGILEAMHAARISALSRRSQSGPETFEEII